MEKEEQRRLYLKDFEEFSETVVLSDELLTLLSEHKILGTYMNTIQNRSDERKKDFILLELTRNRNNCNDIIDLLRQCSQNEAANRLKQYNTSSGRRDYSYDIHIPFDVTDKPMEGSLPYTMARNPRGNALIINNVIGPNLAPKESDRFQYILEKLYFKVEKECELSVTQMIHRLKQFQTDLTQAYTAKNKPQAIVIMIITHGEDEKILGYPFNSGNEDQVKISKIIDMFSDKEFNFLKGIPKLFFFTCCRINERTGFETFCNGQGYTYFGQALSHSIAQYANQESLDQIIIRTNKALKEDFESIRHLKKINGKPYVEGEFSPELRCKGLRRCLYFNPGWPRI